MIESHNLVDVYLRDWWPLYHRQLTNIAANMARDRAYALTGVLEHWLMAQRQRIETMRFIRGHADYVTMRKATSAETLAWLHQALASKPSCTPDAFAAFALDWVPQIIAETTSQLRIAGMALRPVLAMPIGLH